MNFSTGSIISQLIFGIIGMWLVREGRRSVNFATLFIGLTLCVYGWFIESTGAQLFVGIGLCIAAYLTRSV
jgi:hypothetical protein